MMGDMKSKGQERKEGVRAGGISPMTGAKKQGLKQVQRNLLKTIVSTKND